MGTTTQSKIKQLDDLARIVRELKEKGKRVVQCHGTFDLMHPGHIRHFEAAKREGNVLVVTVTPAIHVKKGIGRPVFSDEIRTESIAALSCVDYVALDRHVRPTDEAIELLKPDVFVKGGDYKGREDEVGHAAWREKQMVTAYGGRYHLTDEPVTFSSSHLLNEFFSPYPEETRAFLAGMRESYPISFFSDVFRRMKDLRILVVGDTILDVYHYATPLGRSMKEEIMRVKVDESEMSAGGVIAVANTLAGFCDSVDMVTLLGRKDPEKEKKNESFIRKNLLPNVTPQFFSRDDAPTVTNERFVEKVFLKKYFGIYQIEESPLPKEVEAVIEKHLTDVASSYDAVLVTDYGLGLLSDRLIHVLGRQSKFFAVNTQTNSANMGYNYITKYPRADYISISQPEMRLAYQQRHAPLEDIIRSVAEKLKTRAVTVTLGHKGAFLYDGQRFHASPVLSQKIVDRIGAGDAYLSVSTPCVALGLPLEVVGFLGNAAGAIACTIVANNETVDAKRLLRSVETLLK